MRAATIYPDLAESTFGVARTTGEMGLPWRAASMPIVEVEATNTSDPTVFSFSEPSNFMSHSIRRTRPPAARQQHHYQSGADRVITGGGGHNQALQSNADLYQVGKQYAAMQTRLTAGRNKKATWVAVAAESRVDRPIVMEAVNFVEAVDLIVANCGHRAKKLLLSEHRRLPAKVVMMLLGSTLRTRSLL